MKKESYVLKVLNVMMRTKYPLSAKQICDMVGCERKTVYNCMDYLECSGFPIEISKGERNMNRYKWSGNVCGF